MKRIAFFRRKTSEFVADQIHMRVDERRLRRPLLDLRIRGVRRESFNGRPRTLDSNEHLWLVCAHVPGAADVRVNDTLVGSPGAAGPFAADITALLGARNEIVFAVSSGASIGAVALEVRTG